MIFQPKRIAHIHAVWIKKNAFLSSNLTLYCFNFQCLCWRAQLHEIQHPGSFSPERESYRFSWLDVQVHIRFLCPVSNFWKRSLNYWKITHNGLFFSALVLVKS
jgi:hypothetical protein